MNRLDHLVYAVPDLAAGVAAFAARSGVTPAPGGSHVGRGTANALVDLGDGAYLEIIGPDPAQPDHVGPRPFGVTATAGPRLVGWAVHCADLDGAAAAARAAGVELGEVVAMSRATPDGDLLSWRLTVTDDPAADGLAPFLIDWGATPHPSGRGLPAVALLSFTLTHPDPSVAQAMLDAVGVAVPVAAGPPGRHAVLDTPRGDLAL